MGRLFQNQTGHTEMIIILMGVTGVGKTTVGRALAEELHWRFADGDDFHSAENIAKMHAGIPLTDGDRVLWLQSLRDAVNGFVSSGENVVLACSALKASYRKFLLVEPQVKLVYLRGSFDLIAKRLVSRRGHYMNPRLLRSQFDTLEEPTDFPVVEASLPVARIVEEIRSAFGL
jgi:gluconokinase